MRRPFCLLVLALLLVSLVGGCAFLDDEVQIASASSCISKTCRSEPDAPGYQRCEAACRSTYAR
jgi:hypothetical protein